MRGLASGLRAADLTELLQRLFQQVGGGTTRRTQTVSHQALPPPAALPFDPAPLFCLSVWSVVVWRLPSSSSASSSFSVASSPPSSSRPRPRKQQKTHLQQQQPRLLLIMTRPRPWRWVSQEAAALAL